MTAQVIPSLNDTTGSATQRSAAVSKEAPLRRHVVSYGTSLPASTGHTTESSTLGGSTTLSPATVSAPHVLMNLTIARVPGNRPKAARRPASTTTVAPPPLRGSTLAQPAPSSSTVASLTPSSSTTPRPAQFARSAPRVSTTARLDPPARPAPRITTIARSATRPVQATAGAPKRVPKTPKVVAEPKSSMSVTSKPVASRVLRKTTRELDLEYFRCQRVPPMFICMSPDIRCCVVGRLPIPMDTLVKVWNVPPVSGLTRYCSEKQFCEIV